ncbi:MAG: YoaK family protein [Vibrio sp.]
MISRLPSWVKYGAFILALIAGMINVIGLLSFEHQAVSHLSGTASMIGAQFIAGKSLNLYHLIGLILSFVLGASLSGALLYGGQLKLGHHYDLALWIEAALILLALYALQHGFYWGSLVASCACGLQNALATTYSGAVVRTTHLTGIFTDIGLMLGQGIRGDKLDTRKLILFGCIIAGFVLGGILGAYLFQYLYFWTLIFPALACMGSAIWYRVYSKRRG